MHGYRHAKGEIALVFSVEKYFFAHFGMRLIATNTKAQQKTTRSRGDSSVAVCTTKSKLFAKSHKDRNP